VPADQLLGRDVARSRGRARGCQLTGTVSGTPNLRQ
jgi:hypothetical protein